MHHEVAFNESGHKNGCIGEVLTSSMVNPDEPTNRLLVLSCINAACRAKSILEPTAENQHRVRHADTHISSRAPRDVLYQCLQRGNDQFHFCLCFQEDIPSACLVYFGI